VSNVEGISKSLIDYAFLITPLGRKRFGERSPDPSVTPGNRAEPIAKATTEFNGSLRTRGSAAIEVLSKPAADDIIWASAAADPGRGE